MQRDRQHSGRSTFNDPQSIESMKNYMTVGRRIAKAEWRTFRERYIDNFAFVHINKTGGSSVEHALDLRFAHLTAQEMQWVLGNRQWEKRYTFAFV